MDKTTHEVRLHQWSEVLQAQLASGMSKKEWCRENNVPEKRFYYWQRRVRQELYETEMNRLVPVGRVNRPALVELPVLRETGNPATSGFSPDAVIAFGNVTVGIKETVSEDLLMNIGKMIRHAL